MAELSTLKEYAAFDKALEASMNQQEETPKMSAVISELKRQDEVVENETYSAMIDRAKAGLENVTRRRKESADVVEQASKAFEAATDLARKQFFEVSIKSITLNGELDMIQKGHMAMLSTVDNSSPLDDLMVDPKPAKKEGK